MPDSDLENNSPVAHISGYKLIEYPRVHADPNLATAERAFGDMHANAIYFVNRLMAEGILSGISPTQYHRLLNIWNTPVDSYPLLLRSKLPPPEEYDQFRPCYMVVGNENTLDGIKLYYFDPYFAPPVEPPAQPLPKKPLELKMQDKFLPQLIAFIQESEKKEQNKHRLNCWKAFCTTQEIKVLENVDKQIEDLTGGVRSEWENFYQTKQEEAEAKRAKVDWYYFGEMRQEQGLETPDELPKIMDAELALAWTVFRDQKIRNRKPFTLSREDDANPERIESVENLILDNLALVSSHHEPKMLLAQELQEFDTIVTNATVNPIGLLILMGDLLFDRGKGGDVYMGFIFRKLHQAGCRFVVLLSNHDVPAILFWAKDLWPTLQADIELVESKTSVTPCHSCDAMFAMIDNRLIKQKEVAAMFHDCYFPHLTLLHYSVSVENGIEQPFIYTHAPNGLEIVGALADMYGISVDWEELPTRKERQQRIGEIIREITVLFAAHGIPGLISLLKKEIQRDRKQDGKGLAKVKEGGLISIKYPIFRLIWQRCLYLYAQCLVYADASKKDRAEVFRDIVKDMYKNDGGDDYVIETDTQGIKMISGHDGESTEKEVAVSIKVEGQNPEAQQFEVVNPLHTAQSFSPTAFCVDVSLGQGSLATPGTYLAIRAPDCKPVEQLCDETDLSMANKHIENIDYIHGLALKHEKTDADFRVWQLEQNCNHYLRYLEEQIKKELAENPPPANCFVKRVAQPVAAISAAVVSHPDAAAASAPAEQKQKESGDVENAESSDAPEPEKLVTRSQEATKPELSVQTLLTQRQTWKAQEADGFEPTPIQHYLLKHSKLSTAVDKYLAIKNCLDSMDKAPRAETKLANFHFTISERKNDKVLSKNRDTWMLTIAKCAATFLVCILGVPTVGVVPYLLLGDIWGARSKRLRDQSKIITKQYRPRAR